MKRFRKTEVAALTASCALLLAVSGGWLARAGQQEEEEREAWLENSFYVDTLSFDVESSGMKEKIKGWHDWRDGVFYVALPSYADGEVKLDWKYADSLFIDGKKQKKGKWKYETGRRYLFSFVYDGETAEEFSVELVESGNMPTVFINTESGSMENVDADRQNRETGVFYLLDEVGELQTSDSLTYIKGRGNTTWEQDKKPYSIKLANSHGILGMDASRRWELLANYYDGSNMRNALMLGLAKDAGLEYTPDAKWVDVYLNGVYQGLYQLGEKVETGAGRVDIAVSESGSEETGWLFLMEDASRYSVASGGKFSTDGGQTLVVKNPENAGEAQLKGLESLVQGFENAAVSDAGKALEEYIDVDSFVKKYLIEEIAKNSDAVTNSQYFYKKAEEPVLYAGPAWDYDNALGHTNEEAMDPYGLMLDKIRDGNSNLWYGSLCGRQDFARRVREVYADVFSGLLEEAVSEKIEGWRELLRPAAQMDELRWQQYGKDFRYRVCEDYDAYVDYLKIFLQERKAFLDSVYIDGAVWNRIRFDRGELYSYVDLYAMQGSAGRPAPDCSDLEWDGKHITGWYHEDGTPYDPAKMVDGDMTVYARWEAADTVADGAVLPEAGSGPEEEAGLTETGGEGET